MKAKAAFDFAAPYPDHAFGACRAALAVGVPAADVIHDDPLPAHAIWKQRVLHLVADAGAVVVDLGIDDGVLPRGAIVRIEEAGKCPAGRDALRRHAEHGGDVVVPGQHVPRDVPAVGDLAGCRQNRARVESPLGRGCKGGRFVAAFQGDKRHRRNGPLRGRSAIVVQEALTKGEEAPGFPRQYRRRDGRS
jgi:hypothetical protein